MSEKDGVMDEMERKLRAEALAFKKRAMTAESGVDDLSRNIQLLLRSDKDVSPTPTTLIRLKRMLAAQRRWSRTRHPAYDLNRHILLQRTCNALDQAGQIETATSSRDAAETKSPQNSSATPFI